MFSILISVDLRGFVLHLLGSLPGYLQWDDHPLDHSYDIVRVSPLLAEFLVQTRIIPFLRCTATPLQRERDACYVDNESDDTSKGPKIRN